MSNYRPNHFFVVIVLVLSFLIMAPHDVSAQKRYESKSRALNKWKYKKSIIKPDKLCNAIKRNKKRRYQSPRTYSPSGSRTYAEGAPSSFNPYGNDPKSSSRTVTVEQPAEDFHNKSLAKMSEDEKHTVEDEVLHKYDLPEPSSAKHEQIRKDVQKHLDNFDNEKPLKLEPLYFVVNQDEFAFVDMEPFLVAVEYALHGKIILIEGHTDATGHDDHNVQLSIKRVERIRQLMIEMGVSDDHISVVGYGEEHSETNDEMANDKQLDRRVDFTVF